MTVIKTVKLTRSQQMALIDILVSYMHSDGPQEFVDVQTDTTTTPGDLVRLIGDTDGLEVVEP